MHEGTSPRQWLLTRALPVTVPTYGVLISVVFTVSLARRIHFVSFKVCGSLSVLPRLWCHYSARQSAWVASHLSWPCCMLGLCGADFGLAFWFLLVYLFVLLLLCFSQNTLLQVDLSQDLKLQQQYQVCDTLTAAWLPRNFVFRRLLLWREAAHCSCFFACDEVDILLCRVELLLIWGVLPCGALKTCC